MEDSTQKLVHGRGDALSTTEADDTSLSKKISTPRVEPVLAQSLVSPVPLTLNSGQSSTDDTLSNMTDSQLRIRQRSSTATYLKPISRHPRPVSPFALNGQPLQGVENTTAELPPSPSPSRLPFDEKSGHVVRSSEDDDEKADGNSHAEGYQSRSVSQRPKTGRKWTPANGRYSPEERSAIQEHARAQGYPKVWEVPGGPGVLCLRETAVDLYTTTDEEWEESDDGLLALRDVMPFSALYLKGLGGFFGPMFHMGLLGFVLGIFFLGLNTLVYGVWCPVLAGGEGFVTVMEYLALPR
ncbi:hypothetical protein SCAR479_03176 [Seiridium cardinale]|uniref:Uncharacterized protein n=1 Tax=Seiridium cardinale TaxID=138064 RepID=A0ABR2Y2N4_9PEZI